MQRQTKLNYHKNLPSVEPLVSIIIVNFNGGEMLMLCLKSVFDCKYKNIEVILVDNGSTDGSITLAEELFGERRNFKVVKLHKNIGFAQGNNLGVRYAIGKYIVFLNNDTVVDPWWLNELVKVMENDETIGAAQSKLLQLNNPKIFDSAGDFMDSYCLSFSRGHGEEDRGQYDQIEEIFSARGAAMIVRSNALRRIGLFDSLLFGSCEDIDLCWRLRLMGYRILYVPKSVVHHVVGATIKRLDATFTTFHQTKNTLIISLKNKDLKELILHPSIIPTIGAMILDIINRKNPKLFIARLRAIMWCLVKLREICQRRLQTQNMKNQPTVNDAILKSSLIAITRCFIYSFKFGSQGHKLYFSYLITKHMKKWQ
ncbi:MAG: glycosyltransferase family 2 protein [Candidatus Bathyarchaeia archaeon]